jgi:transcriptional regulator with XRE-family HTH domain
VTFNGPAIRFIRTSQGVKQGELAHRAGISQGHLSNVERGHDRLNERKGHLIASVLGVDDLRVLLGPDEMPATKIHVDPVGVE